MDFYGIFDEDQNNEQEQKFEMGFFNASGSIEDSGDVADNNSEVNAVASNDVAAFEFDMIGEHEFSDSVSEETITSTSEESAEFQMIVSDESIVVMEFDGSTTDSIVNEEEQDWIPQNSVKSEVTHEVEMISETPFPVTEADPLGLVGAAAFVQQEFENTTQHTNTQTDLTMTFDLPTQSSIIKVIGVGGGGSNAVNHMYRMGIKGVDFVVCNTDKQALDMSPVPNKVVLGATLTEGRGAGSIPEVGRNAAIENIEDIRQLLANNTKMAFITAGMGGGTGTGAAPIIAGIAKELGVLTVGIVTVPFAFEGNKRKQQAEQGLEQLKQNVDTLLVICNDKLREMYGNLKLSDAFGHADDVLTIAAKSIAEIISISQQINVDFADVCTVMRDSGVAIMGSASVSGENRAVRAVEQALMSPLLNDNNISGARYVLLNIVSGTEEITMDELGEITDYIQEAAGQTAEIIKGYGVNPELGDAVNVTIIATGFNQSNPVAYEYSRKPEQEIIVKQLDETPVQELFSPPVQEVKAPEATVDPLEPFLISKNEGSVISNEVSSSSNVIEFEVNNVAEVQMELNISEVEMQEEELVQEPELLEPVLKVVEPTEKNESSQEEVLRVEKEEQQRRKSDRVQKLKEMSLKLKTQAGLSEIENEPAYKRRNVQLDNVPHSSETQVSRYTLTENEDKKIEIRPNNSFLHDNVD